MRPTGNWRLTRDEMDLGARRALPAVTLDDMLLVGGLIGWVYAEV